MINWPIQLDKFLTYKDTVNSIYVEDKNSFTLNTNPCEFKQSPFIDPHYKCFITGDLINCLTSDIVRGLTTENLDQLISTRLLLKWQLPYQIESPIEAVSINDQVSNTLWEDQFAIH